MKKKLSNIRTSILSVGMTGLLLFSFIPANASFANDTSSDYEYDQDSEDDEYYDDDESTESAADSQKCDPALSIKTKSKTYKDSVLKKTKKRFKVKVKNAVSENDNYNEESLSLSYEKVSGDDSLTVSEDGTVTVKKGTEAGKYTITVKVSSSETENFTESTDTKKITVKVKDTEAEAKKAEYDAKVAEFISDSRFKDNASYGVISPKLSSYSCVGCCAYAADFVKYVFGASGPRAGSSFSSVSSIQDGDVLRFVNGQHWVVVLYRDGNQLTTAEGNWAGKVVVSDSAYSIKNGTVYRSGSKFRTFDIGYHYL